MNEEAALVHRGFQRRKSGMFTAWFVSIAVAMLAVTGVAKVWSAFGSTKLLVVVDPMTGMQFKHLMLTVGVFELVIAGFCVFATTRKSSLALIAWLATCLLGYRLGLWCMGWHRPCGCMGNLTDALHISPRVADDIMRVILAYLLIGSYGILFWQWRKEQQARLHVS